MKFCHSRQSLSLLLLGIVTSLFAAPSTQACNVPVFRYALERWKADAYDVIVFHRGELQGQDKKVLKHLNQFTGTPKMPPILNVITVDLDKNKDKEVLKIFKEQKVTSLPWMMVFHPRANRIIEPLWTGRMDAKVIDNLVTSPSRKEIAKRLLKGQTSVALFVESGNKKKDDRAAKVLEETLKALPKKLKLPELKKDDPADLLQTGEELVPLKIDFSMIRVSRDDPKEKMLIEMLQKSENDLPKDEPMVLFIYGRGRSLFAFVGAGITKENIERAGQFLCGPCSCEIKRDNPGFDVLFYVDWEGGIRGRYVDPKDPPPLTGLLPGPAKKDDKDEKDKK